MFIEILTPTFERLAAVPRFTSLQWTHRFYGVGSFELHLSPSDPSLPYIADGNLIQYGNRCGIIRYRAKPTQNDIKICGYNLSGLLSQRVCGGILTGSAVEIMHSLVDANMVNPTDTARKITGLSIETDTTLGESITWDCQQRRVDMEVSAIGEAYEVGFEIVPDGTGYIFRTLHGTDRTASQSDIPPVIFSERRRNIENADYTYDALTAFNVLVTDEATHDPDSKTGYERIEGYYSASPDDDWKAILSENSPKESITATANSRIAYGEDYMLGDYVTVTTEAFGQLLQLDLQVTEVLEVFEQGNRRTVPTFGQTRKSIIKEILRRV